jgi:hypothetical protein
MSLSELKFYLVFVRSRAEIVFYPALVVALSIGQATLTNLISMHLSYLFTPVSVHQELVSII